jgi:hypothetical protein
MYRREFLKMLAAGMAAGWAYQCWPEAVPWPGEAAAAAPGLVIACLADAHLKDGNDRRPEALALARAVAEVINLAPGPHLALFAGDLAHDGDPGALALGREILSDLNLPVLMVRGEGDGRPAQGEAGSSISQAGRFFYTQAGVNLLGLDTVWQDGPGVPGFALGESQYRWLNGVLDRLNAAAPLVILSHAPLTPIYRPWGQWTRDSGPLLARLARFRSTLLIHAHVHHWEDVAAHGGIFPGKTSLPQAGEQENFSWGGLQPVSLPATSWPLPSPLTGTPRQLRPGLGPRGCGWAQVQTGGQTPQMRQVLWQA